MTHPKIKKDELEIGLEVYIVPVDTNIIADFSKRKIQQVLAGNDPSVVIEDEEGDREVVNYTRLRHVSKPQEEEIMKTEVGEEKPTVAKSAKKTDAKRKAKPAKKAKKKDQVKKAKPAKKKAPTKKKAVKPATKKAPTKKKAVKPATKKAPTKKKIDFKMDKQNFKYMRKEISHDSGKEAFTYAVFPKNNEDVYYTFQVYGGVINEGFDPYKRPIPVADAKGKVTNIKQRIELLKEKDYSHC